MARLPRTISLMRRGGTPMARASPFCVRPMGSMNSSNRISPGVGLGISLVVVDDFDMIWTSWCPYEADAPLLVDADAVLAGAIALQGLEPVVRWHREVGQHLGVIEQPQFAQCGLLNVVRQSPAELATPDKFGLPGSEPDDHG